MSDRRILIAVCVGIGLVIGAAGGVLVMLSLRTPTKVVIESSSLTPDPSAVRYRHPVRSTAPASDAAATIAELEARMKAHPQPHDALALAELYLRRAQRDGDPKDWGRSEAMAARSLELQPRPNKARLTLARLAAVHHDFKQAIALVREQFEEKHVPEGYVLLATSHLALGELREALDAITIVIDRRPDSEAYLIRALILEQSGREAEAAHDFTRAAALEGYEDQEESARLRTLWARFLMRRGEHAGARIALDEAARLAPNSPLVTAYRGELALRSGDPAEARRLFEDAFAKGRQVRYLIDQARAVEVAGDRAAANALRHKVEGLVRADLQDGGTGHRLELVEVLVDQGEPAKIDEAITLGGAELALRAGTEVRFQLARALSRRSGRPDEAMKLIQAALATGVRDPRLYELAAHLDGRLGNTLRSAVYAYEAKRLDPQGTGWRKLGIGPP